jgi:hypothetical protein
MVQDAGPEALQSATPNDPTAPSSAVLALGFAGVDGTAKDGFLHTPPDTHMAVGPGVGAAGRVIMVTNSGIQIWNKTGASLAGPTPLGTFLGLGPTAAFDPKVLYDQHSGRFFMVILEGSTPNPGGTSNVHIAVSSSGTPGNLTTDWTKLSASALTLIGAINTWFDYPGIGADSDSLFVTGNMFDSGGFFRGAKIRVFDKAALLAGAYTFTDINVDTAVTSCFTVQPAHVYGTTDNGAFYLINRIGSTTYRVMQITGDPGAPVLSSNAAYAWTAGLPAPSGAPQSGTGILVATLSARIMNAVYRGGYIWLALTSDPDGDSKSEAFWAKIATGSGSPSVSTTGYVDGSDGVEWTFMPSINVNASGIAMICYSQSYTDQFPDMRYVNTTTGAPDTFGASTVVATSPDFYDSFVTTVPDRWGDYSACVLDPDDDNFWIANEVVKTSGVGTSIWDTFIANLVIAIPPTVSSIVRAGANPTNAASVNFTVTFSESVTGVDASDFALTVSGVAGASVGTVSGSGATRTVAVSTGTGDGTIRLDVTDNDTIVNGSTVPLGGAGAGNGNFTTGESYTIDKTSPTVSMSSAAPNPTNTSPIPVTVTFSESVTGFAAGDVTVANATLSGFAGSGASYSFNLTPTGQGLVTANIAAAVCTDPAGNGNTAAATFSRTYDSVAPTVSMSSAAPNPTNTSPIPVTVTFSESVTGFVAGDVTVGNATLSGFAGSGASYSFNLTPTGQGLVTANIAAGVAQDSAANGNTAAAPFSRTYDSVAPTVSMSSAAPNPTNTSPILVTVTFSESVTGFTAPDVTPSSATVSNFAGSGASYTFNLVPTAQGLVAADIGAGVCQDAATNLNTAATRFQRTFDNVRPTVILASAAPDPTTSSPIQVTATFSESVTGFAAGDIIVSSATVANFAGSGAAYSFDLVPTTQGLVTASVPAGAAQDAVGNLNLAGALFGRIYGTQTPPQAVALTRLDPSPTSLSAIRYLMQFDKSVTGVDTADFDLVTTGLTGASVTSVADGAITYTITVQSGSGAGSLRLNLVDNDTILDASSIPLGGVGLGNGNLSGQLYSIDTLAPQSQVTSPSGSLFQADPVIPIAYSASDSGVGVRSVRLYYRKTLSGPFLRYGGEFTSSPISFDTSATGGNARYQFYTVGVDQLGNIETAPAQADVTVYFNVTTAVPFWTRWGESMTRRR